MIICIFVKIVSRTGNPFGMCVKENCIIDKLGLARFKALEYGFNLTGGVESVILAVVFLLASCIVTLSAPTGLIIFFLFFHGLKIMSIFAETYQVGGWVPANPLWNLNSYLKADSNFPNLQCYFQAHNGKDSGRFFPTPFQAFRIPLCNPSLITLQRYKSFLKKQNKIK